MARPLDLARCCGPFYVVCWTFLSNIGRGFFPEVLRLHHVFANVVNLVGIFEAVFVWIFENWFTYKSVRGCKYFCFEHVLVCVLSTNIISKLVSLIKCV